MSTSGFSPALTQFLERSPCPFAQRAAIFSCTPWRRSMPATSDLDTFAEEMARFVEDPDFDLAVLEVRTAQVIASPPDAGGLVHAVLGGLRARDALTQKSLLEGIDNPHWDFEFGRQAFFVSLFAPFYPPDHSRWSGEPGVAFLLLQPERGFRRFGVSSHLPARRRLSEHVHSRFEAHGRPYELWLNTDAPKALRYVKPLQPGDPPVRWWELPPERPTH